MDKEYLEMVVDYNLRADTFQIRGDLNQEGQREIIENFIRSQIGEGKDTRQPKRQEVYHVSLKWYPENDRFVFADDTGNKSLSLGILGDVLKRLNEASGGDRTRGPYIFES